VPSGARSALTPSAWRNHRNLLGASHPDCATMLMQPRRERILWFRKRVLNWYGQNGRAFWWRRRRLSAYQLVVAETLLQRTQASAVEKHIRKFLTRFRSWSSLARASLRGLQQTLKPLGLWRRRAVALRSLARTVVKNRGKLPANRESLELTPGIGQYIASAVLTYWHGQAEALLDVNMARVLERFFGPRQLTDIRYDPYLQKLARKAVHPRRPREYNWGVLDFAALVCTPRKPRCAECPLRTRCRYYSSSNRSGSLASGNLDTSLQTASETRNGTTDRQSRKP
jgi:A/G-specific adenine glycosylase